MPFASAKGIRCIETIVEGSGMVVVAGDGGGRIGVWRVDANGVKWVGALEGHVGEVRK